MLPFRHLPRIVLIHLVKKKQVTALPTNDGITRTYSPQYIMTGQHMILASKHAVIEFGAYVQTHEQHTNKNMSQRTMGCISLGPTGDQQAGRPLVHVHLLG